MGGTWWYPGSKIQWTMTFTDHRSLLLDLAGMGSSRLAPYLLPFSLGDKLGIISESFIFRSNFLRRHGLDGPQMNRRWPDESKELRRNGNLPNHAIIVSPMFFSCPAVWQNRRLADQPNFGTRKKITVDPEIFELRCRHGLIQNPMVSIQLAAGCLVFRLTDGFARNALLANQIQLFQPLVEWVLRPEKVALSHFQPLKCCLIHVNPIKIGEVEKSTSFHSSWDMTTKLQFML